MGHISNFGRSFELLSSLNLLFKRNKVQPEETKDDLIQFAFVSCQQAANLDQKNLKSKIRRWQLLRGLLQKQNRYDLP